MTNQAIVRNTRIVSHTFVSRPSPELIQKLKAAGFKFDNGNWYKAENESRLLDEADIAASLAE